MLSRADIERALARLGELAQADGKAIDLVVVGGTAMVLGFDARLSTKDVDAVSLSPVDALAIRGYSAQVAGELNWEEDWLNDGAKGYLQGLQPGPVVFQASGIRVIRPATEQLLAMKLSAWRDDVDIADAELLLRQLLPCTLNDLRKLVGPFVTPGRELKANYALDDLWSHIGGVAGPVDDGSMDGGRVGGS
jgi:hypothetical protein